MGLIGPGKCRRINGISYLSLPDYRRLFKLPQQIHPMQAMHHLPEQICVNDRQIEEGVHEARAVDARVKSLIDFLEINPLMILRVIEKSASLFCLFMLDFTGKKS